MSFRNFIFIFLLIFSIYTTILDLRYPSLGIKSFVIQFASWIVATILLILSVFISILGSVGNTFLKPFGIHLASNFDLNLYGTLIFQDVVAFGLIFQLSIVSLIIYIPMLFMFIFIVAPSDIIVKALNDSNINALWSGNSHSLVFILTNTKLATVRIPGIVDIIGLESSSKPLKVVAGTCPVCVSYSPNLNIWHLLDQFIQLITFNDYLASFGVSVTNPGVVFLLKVLTLYGLKF